MKQLETDNQFIKGLFQILKEWGIFFESLIRPHVLIPLIFCIVSLIFANRSDVNKTLSVILQIISAFSLSIAGAFFFDFLRTFMGKSLLEKKGLSAVRNLSLARTKVVSISKRVAEDGTKEELKNLLSMLEKDIANATQEWNDIIPGVNTIEQAYQLLAEKEAELKINIEEKGNLDKRLQEERELGELEETEKQSFKKQLDDSLKSEKALREEISRLRLVTSSSPISVGSAGATFSITSFEDRQTLNRLADAVLRRKLEEDKKKDSESK